MKRLLPFTSLATLAALSLAALSGCGTYYASGGTSYGQSGVVYNGATTNTSGQGTAVVDEDGNVVGYTDTAPPTTTGQDVYIGAEDGDYVDTDPSALTEFRTTLDPYGTWYDDGTYGTVWMPSASVVGADFAPYVTAGHWSYADDYVWVSDYDWGWAPFHYGRWVYIAGRGWAWIPGRRYAGAWVSWRVGDGGYGYVGWGPLAPTWYWRSGIAVGLNVYPPTPYTFCSTHDLFHPVVATRVVAGPAVQAIASGTRVWASPTVSGNGRTPATPSVGVQAPSTGRMLGPPPGTLGIQPQAVIPLPTGDRGLLRAQQFARPQTAIAAGARGPQVYGAPSTTDPRPRLPTTVIQGGPQVYTRPAPVPGPTYQTGTGYVSPSSPPPTYTPPPTYVRPASPPTYTPYTPPPTYVRPASPPPVYTPPPTYVRPASPPPVYTPPPTYVRPASPPPVYNPPPTYVRPASPPPAAPVQVRPAPATGAMRRR